MNDSSPQPRTPAEEIAGLVERVTFFNPESGFAVLRVKVRGQRDLVTVLGSLPSVSAGEWLTAKGWWVRDKEHGFQFKATVLKAVPPTTVRTTLWSLTPCQLHHVLSDIVGVNGTAILDAILSGERDPFKLANLCNRRIRSPRQTVAKSLEGDYRPEHLFALRQSLAAYRIYKQLMAEVDFELAQKMREPGI